ncbi:surface-adhesin E family protein [Methylobacillus sp. Pita2]|uniref:surface-adhesin E family protein n=1 Tax=Methylobacillus sp. Pita2 TaxID=3383245 RepID=UPI0038B60A7E
MYPYILLSAALFLSPTSALATEWESLVKKAGAELSVDLDSYDEKGAYSSILAKREVHGKQAFAKQMKLEFDCGKQTYRTLATASFDAKGKLLSQTAGTREFLSLQHDEDARTIAGLVCQVRRMVNPSS